MGPFWGVFFLSFNGGSKYGGFLWIVGPCIRIWFALPGVLVDWRFFQLRRAIEVIEMIEVIEVIWGSAGWGCVFWGGSGGGSSWRYVEFWTVGFWRRVWVFPMV